MGEDCSPVLSALVEFDLYVYISYHISGSLAAGLVLPVSYASTYDDPVIEKLGGESNIEYVVSGIVLLIAESEIQWDVEFLHDVAHLT